MQSATEIKRTAQRAGVLYLAMSICAMVGYLYLHRLFFISGDPAATARSILARAGLYRASIVLDLFGEIVFILVVLDLYHLFRDVDRNHARVMVALIGTGIAVQFATFVLNAVPLMLLSGADYLSVFSQQQLETMSYLSLSLAGKQGELLMSIWGLWLFPFAMLTIKSGFLPKFLGVLLLVTGVAYVVACVTTIAFPELAHAVNKVAFPLYFGEFIVVLWMAFVGAKPRTAEGSVQSSH